MVTTSTDRIFRVEYHDQRGVYQALNEFEKQSAVEAAGMVDKLTQRHPGPEGDPLLRPTWQALVWKSQGTYYRFAFSSLQQAARWFHRKIWLTRLDNLGVVLSHYDVPSNEVHHGTAQCIFRASAGSIVHQQKMIELWPIVKQIRKR